MSGLRIEYVDAQLLIVEKPAGLLAVPGRGEDKQDCLIARLLAPYPDALVVHRLDMATSGLMVFARDPPTQAALGQAFAERRIFKRYVAVVDGRPSPDHSGDDGWSVIDLPLIADWPNRPLQKVDRAAGKPSVTRWRALGPDADHAGATRVELEPLTGRSHQLRVHLQAIGHAILGDALYATTEAASRAPRLLLHAQTLGFAHPVTGDKLRFDSAPDF
ncbi:RluA family pseudouridine synthase [Xylophilus sp. GOD-11R]|uniref:RluA family pseudouridine synthase n=1 Tax=Xylophilus sp. GOD-11R TaxID=3089814 RepID=UPI00298BF28F|nr:pseudouridine synthase [Xylophilus sp. GOD-11R]WPB59175.1 pseudouridine synthase [Xylophilus sp. GOD-11R]